MHMKLCIISTLYPPNIVGGAEKVTAKLAAALVRAGHEIVVITLHDSQQEKIEICNGVKVYYLPIDNIYWPFTGSSKPSAWKRLLWHTIDMWNVKAAVRIGNILDIEKPEILNSNNLAGFSVAAWNEAAKRGISIVHTLHDYALLCPRATLFNHGKLCDKRCALCVSMSIPKRAASRRVSHVVGVSKFVANQHIKNGFFPSAKRHVIYNIGETADIAPTPNHPNAALTFGFIGRVEEEKGIEVLLQATSQLPKDGWRLLIAGRGREEYVARLKAAYPQASIEWLGFVKADDFYKQVDVSIVPSLWPEPLPGVIAEAAAWHIPLIISKMGGMPEYLEMGVRGIAVPAGNAQRLGIEMSEAMQGRGVMAQPVDAKQAWKDELSERTVVARYLACYNECLMSRSNNG